MAHGSRYKRTFFTTGRPKRCGQVTRGNNIFQITLRLALLIYTSLLNNRSEAGVLQ
jgi:hypothetical protein